MSNLLNDKQRKVVTAQLILSRLVMIDAPFKVIQAIKEWCKELSSEQGDKKEVFTQGIKVSDTCEMALVNEGRKSDA